MQYGNNKIMTNTVFFIISSHHHHHFVENGETRKREKSLETHLTLRMLKQERRERDCVAVMMKMGR